MDRVVLVVTAFVAIAGCAVSPLTGNDPEDVGQPLEPIVVEPVVEVSDDFGDDGIDYWVASVRWGNNNSEAGNYELEVGNGSHFENGTQRATGGMVWTSGATNEFSLEVDLAGVATLTVSSPSMTSTISYETGGAAGDVYLYSNAPARGSVEVTTLTVPGVAELSAPISHSGSETDRSHVLFKIDLAEYDFSDGLSLSGTFVLTWDTDSTTRSTQQESPNIGLKVGRP